MRIDPAGHHGVTAEVQCGPVGGVGNAGDAAALDDDFLVREDVALAVDERRGLDNDRLSHGQGGEEGESDTDAEQ